MVHLLRKDNEELGVICVKIVINFNRTYRAILEPHIMPFVEWIVELYDGMAAVVERTFSVEASGPSSSSSTAFSGLNPEVWCVCSAFIHSLISSGHNVDRKSASTTSSHVTKFQSSCRVPHSHRALHK